MIQTALLLGCFALGLGPEENQLRAKVEQWVAQLNAPQLAVRQAAEDQLLRHGPAVLAFLPARSARLPAETRERLARVRQRLEQLDAEAAIKPSLVSLPDDPRPLSEILASLERQTGNRLIHARGPNFSDPRSRVAFDRTPFWSALDQILVQTGLTFESHPDAIRLIEPLTDATKRPRTTPSYSGPFRFDVAGVNVRAADATVISIQVAWEPRVQVISLAQPMATVVAKTDAGAELPAVNPAAQLEIPVNLKETSVRFGVPIDTSTTDQQLTQLRGRLDAIVAGKREAFRFTDLPTAKNVDQRIASATVTLEAIRKTEDGYEVRMLLCFDEAGGALASHRTWIFNNPAYLESREGKQISYKSYETVSQEKNALGLAFLFETAEPLTALTFVYQTPVAIFTSQFGYDLKIAPRQ